MTIPSRSFFPITLLLLLPPALSAQLYGPAGGAQGGGTFGDCDTLLTVDFTVEPLGGLQQQFTSLIDSPGHSITDMTWTYYTGELQQEGGTTIQPTYPAPGESPVCFTVNAIDLSTSLPCSSTICHFVEILPDPSCLAYEPDFNIVAVNGQTVSFEAGGNIPDSTSIVWDLGNGTGGLTTLAESTFEGPGPHRICLTVVGPPPINCTASVCKWLYLGPGDLPCEEVLQPGFLHFQNDNIVVVLDTSYTTGQNATVHWDFGDGATAVGPVAFHIYPPWDMVYDLCATVDLSGPLANDGCISTQCTMVGIGWAAVSIKETDELPIRISPNPAEGTIMIEGLPPGPVPIEVTDACGRPVLFRTLYTDDRSVMLPIEGLSAGMYLLRCRTAAGMATGRFLKH